MATKKKMLQAAAGQAGGAALDITDVFSTYLYTGNGSTQTITNGIDLAGEGGLVWIKWRSGSGITSSSHILTDTERGATKALLSDQTLAELTDSAWLTSFNSNGFSVGDSGNVNDASNDYASWTFRKAPKFFDVVTWTGDGSASRNISHNLGATVGTIIVKRYNTTEDWVVFHRSLGANNQLKLNKTDAAGSLSGLFISTPTDSVFTVGSNSAINANGSTYVAYLFAHNDGDGEFGPDGDQDIIKCGSYTGNGSETNGTEVDLGFEPQWLLVKASSTSADWFLVDNMRGWGPPNTGQSSTLKPNTSASESSNSYNTVEITPTGFKLHSNTDDWNGSGQTYIYIAIRRGPLAPPESGTEVFAMDVGDSDGDSSTPEFVSGFPVDAGLVKQTNGTGNFFLLNRLNQGATLYTNLTSVESTSSVFAFDYSNGFYGGSRNADYQAWMWKRAPGFFDVVAYTGDGTSIRDVNHSLGVIPELAIVKRRDSTGDWYVTTLSDKNDSLRLNTTASQTTDNAGIFLATYSTETTFNLRNTASANESGATYIAYLFATLPGVSKVGSYTGDGTTDGSKVIDCGFTSGARFVLIKPSSYADSWFVFDSVRGITVGVDPRLKLDTTDAEASYDLIDPDSSGFTPSTGTGNLNQSGETYIFYAIA